MNDDAQTHPDHDSELERTVRRVAEEALVAVRFPTPRRETDLLLVQLRGERRDVLTVPTRLAEELTGYDLEIIEGRHVGDPYQLALAITLALDVQVEHTLTPERRAKLRRRVGGDTEHDAAAFGEPAGEPDAGTADEVDPGA